MDGLTEGRIVHYVMPNGQHRPAIIVNTWRDLTPPCEGYINLQVFTDGSNDLIGLPEIYGSMRDQIAHGMLWATSICPDEAEKKPGTWHWIEKVTPEAPQIQMTSTDTATMTQPIGQSTFQTVTFGKQDSVEPEKVATVVDWKDYAKSAYRAYGAVTDHKNYQGLPMPEWEALTDKIREAWIGAVQDVFRKLKVRDDATGKLYVE